MLSLLYSIMILYNQAPQKTATLFSRARTEASLIRSFLISSIAIPPIEKGGPKGAQKTIIIGFREDSSQDERETFLKGRGLHERFALDSIDAAVVPAPQGQTPEGFVKALEQIPESPVSFAEADSILAPDLIPDDPWFLNWQQDKQ